MAVNFIIKNYRCFPDSSQARISVRSGFTALVGVNNSGKSSLLKFFYEFRQLFAQLQGGNNNLLAALKGQSQSFSIMPGVFDIAELFSNINNRDLEIIIELPEDPDISANPPRPKRLTLHVARDTNTYFATLHSASEAYHGPSNNFAYHSQGQLLLNHTHPVANLVALSEISQDLSSMLYVGPFRNAINVGAKDDYFDIQVGQAFFERWKEYQTGSNKKQNEAIYRLSDAIKAIFGFKELQIQPSADNVTLQVFINGKSYKLPELGSGLTQFILVLANAAIKNPSYILIDEPELNLHPSLQIDFLTTLGSYARRGVIFSTHNVGLARSIGEQIYSLRRVGEGDTDMRLYDSTPRLSEFLGELSFSGYQALGFSKVVLVEGSTDLKTVQQFLRMYGKDHKIVLLPLGGSQLIKDSSEAELNEIKRITENVFAIIDSERSSASEALAPDREAFAGLCATAKIQCLVLNRRAMENYLTDRAVKLVKGDKYRGLGYYEKLKDVNPAWGKDENWRIAREMSLKEIDQTDLGKFLREL
ncbi:MAG: ATP-binding protein [Deltaproteobacteria bacterium]|nr:ATP-binding protein [Deltaproteobacteria bacterium]